MDQKQQQDEKKHSQIKTYKQNKYKYMDRD